MSGWFIGIGVAMIILGIVVLAIDLAMFGKIF